MVGIVFKVVYGAMYIALCKSLIKSKNNTAPSTDPCGTPYVDISLSELYSLILVY